MNSNSKAFSSSVFHLCWLWSPALVLEDQDLTAHLPFLFMKGPVSHERTICTMAPDRSSNRILDSKVRPHK